jgi:hypothetical protein
MVAVLADGEYGPGTHKVSFNASGFSSGTYLYKLRAGNILETKKLLVLK